jgi:hypothetical protein
MANRKPADSAPAKPQPGPAAAAGDNARTGPGATPGTRPNLLLGSSLTPVTAQTRRTMIAEAAYYMAEQRGFAQGGDIEDWLRAEKQIDAVLSA